MRNRWISAGTYVSLFAITVLFAAILICGMHAMPAMAGDCPMVTAPAICPMGSVAGLSFLGILISSAKTVAWAVISLIVFWLVASGFRFTPVLKNGTRQRPFSFSEQPHTFSPLAEAFADGRIQPLLYA